MLSKEKLRPFAQDCIASFNSNVKLDSGIIFLILVLVPLNSAAIHDSLFLSGFLSRNMRSGRPSFQATTAIFWDV